MGKYERLRKECNDAVAQANNTELVQIYLIASMADTLTHLGEELSRIADAMESIEAEFEIRKGN